MIAYNKKFQLCVIVRPGTWESSKHQVEAESTKQEVVNRSSKQIKLGKTGGFQEPAGWVREFIGRSCI